MAKLYELTDEYIMLAALLEESEVEEARNAIMEKLESVSDDIAKKGEAYARIMKNMQADAEAYEKEIKRLAAKKKAAENAVVRLKNNMLFALGIAGATELRTSIGKWRVQLNNPSVQIIDKKKIPEEFFIEQPPKLMNSLILSHWKETGEIPDGCDIVQTESVRFR